MALEEERKRELGERLKELRTEARSQEEIARKIGVSTKTYGLWERGLTFPRPQNIEGLADVFGVDTDFVLNGDRGPTPDLLGPLNGSQLDRIEQDLREIKHHLGLDATKPAGDGVRVPPNQEALPTEPTLQRPNAPDRAPRQKPRAATRRKSA